MGRVAPRRPDALLVHVLRLHNAGEDELDVFRREGRRGDIGEGMHVQGHPGPFFLSFGIYSLFVPLSHARRDEARRFEAQCAMKDYT